MTEEERDIVRKSLIHVIEGISDNAATAAEVIALAAVVHELIEMERY